MDKIKDALWTFLRYNDDTVIEWDYTGTVISGVNDIFFISIRHPKITPDHTWYVCIWPRVCIDTGAECDGIGLKFDSDVEICNYLKNFEDMIYKQTLDNLSKAFKELKSSYDYQIDIGEDRDLLD